jgi:H+/Cl- antiporter ClcA
VIGREGPTIQISASIFKKINSSLPHWYPKISMQQMIVTGAAAGLASAFNTPLGGIVFAIEELTKKHFNIFKSALLTGVIIAGLTSLYLLGNYLYLGFPDLQGIGYKILYAVIPVAVIAGLAGSGMGAAILWIFKQKNRLRTLSSKIGYIAACGLLIATLAFFIDHRILGSGKEIMVSTLFGAEKHVEWYLPFLRLFGSIASFTCGASGGIFAPSLSTGASIGSSLAGLLQLSPTDTNLVILCGMTAFLTGITRSPFTASILVLEMTNTHTVIFHLMLTALIANLIANLLGRHSFYDQLKVQYINEIERMEEPLQPAKQQAPLFNNQGAGI